MTEGASGRSHRGAARARIVVHCDAPGWRRAFPRPVSFLRKVAQRALMESGEASGQGPDEVSLLLTDDRRQQVLNREWRGRDEPTNVLAFPDGTLLPEGGRLLGDVVLALESCQREAVAQDKCLADHAAHLLVHGLLHLLGYDHADAEEASVMEGLEVRLLSGLGIANPYGENDRTPPDDPARDGRI